MNVIKNSVWIISKIAGLSNGIYRVLELFPELGTLILFELNDIKKTRPKLYNIDDFSRGIQQESIKHYEYQVPVWMLAGQVDLSDKHRIRRDKNFSLISPLLNDPNFLFRYALDQRSPLLRQYARKNNISYSTLKSWINLCWKYGRGKQSLTPAYAKCGGTGVKKKLATVPNGRKIQGRVLLDKRPKTYRMLQKDESNICKIITKYYLTDNPKTLKECWSIFLDEYFHETQIAGRNSALPHPSQAQFQYRVKRLFSLDEIARRQTTERDFLLNKRALSGASATPDILPGEIFEIDATVADVHLISELSGQLVGRPTVYIIADRATRMITGMHVSYLYASWRAAAQALANCFLPKKEYCQLFGINDINNSTWPCCHVPTKLLCDNAEMLGLKSQEAVIPFTELMFAPSYRADLKSIVESRFHILNHNAIHKLKGTTRGGYVIRGEERPELKACYTLKAFTEIMIHAVNEHNHALNTDLIYINPLLLENNLAATPINSWNISMAKLRFYGYKVTEQEVISQFLYPDRASITSKGIQYGNRFYECTKEEMVMARSFGQTRIDVRIDDNSMNKIYVRSGKEKIFSPSELLPRRKIFRDMPHMEADIVADILDIQKSISVNTPESVKLRNLIKNKESEGELLLSELRKNGRSRVKNVRENRRKELLNTQQGKKESSEDDYRLPLANNIFILPGPEERKEWLATKNDPENEDD